jgi:hypothetical protein
MEILCQMDGVFQNTVVTPDGILCCYPDSTRAWALANDDTFICQVFENKRLVLQLYTQDKSFDILEFAEKISDKSYYNVCRYLLAFGFALLEVFMRFPDLTKGYIYASLAESNEHIKQPVNSFDVNHIVARKKIALLQLYIMRLHANERYEA